MASVIGSVIDLLSGFEFLWSLGAGLVAVASLAVLPARFRWWGLAVVAATLVGLVASGEIPLRVLAGTGALAGGGLLLGGVRSDGRTAAAWTVIVVGAVLVGADPVPRAPGWVPWVAPVVVVAIGLALASWRLHPARQWLGPLVAVSALGLWSVIPDTDLVGALVGATLATAVATVDRDTRLMPAGALALAGLLVWLAVEGGVGRGSSIIGAWGVVGMLGLVPLVGFVPRRSTAIGPLALAIGHVILVALAGRVFGRWASATTAVAGIVVTWTVAGLLLTTVWAAGDRGSRPGVT